MKYYMTSYNLESKFGGRVRTMTYFTEQFITNGLIK